MPISLPAAMPVTRPPASVVPARVQPAAVETQPVRFLFFSDAHAGFKLLDQFIEKANRERPELVIDGGDFVEEGTEPEFARAAASRAKLEVPLHVVTGNHDVLRRGRFSQEPGALPEFRSFDHRGVHFVLLDNQNERISDHQFQQLEADLEANRGKPTLVVMHVPPLLSKTPLAATIGKALPFNTASPVMTDRKEVDRFTGLMSRFGVSAVLSGHTHAPDALVKDGVQYVVAGALGAKTPGPGVAHEYLDITVKGREVAVKRVPMDKAPGDPFRYLYQTGAYVARMNHLNHQGLGWDTYVPSNQVQLRTGARLSETKGGTSVAGTASAVMEHTFDPRGKSSAFAESTLAVGSRELSTDLAVGYKRRLVGDFNHGLLASGAATANGGLIGGRGTAGVGVRVGVGAEVRQWTVELSHERATNRQMTGVTVGYRF